MNKGHTGQRRGHRDTASRRKKGSEGDIKAKGRDLQLHVFEDHSLLEKLATESFELSLSHYHYEQKLTFTLVWSSAAKSSI